MTQIRTSLQSHQPYTPWNEDDVRAKAARLWHESGGKSLMLKTDWLRNDLDQQMLRNIGKMLFGEPRK